MVLFLLHVRASIVIAITLPMAVLMSFIAMKLFGVDANIMSLAGIAIAIGTMVDMGIIVLENIYGGLADWEAAGLAGRRQAAAGGHSRIGGARSCPAVITAVSTTIVSFLPVFFLTGRDHRLFAPLAWTKTFALASSLIVAVTVVPMLCRIFLRSSRPQAARAGRWSALALGGAASPGSATSSGATTSSESTAARPALGDGAGWRRSGFLVGWWMTREKIRPMEENPVSRFVLWLYAGRLRLALRRKALMLSLPAMIFVLGLGRLDRLADRAATGRERVRRCSAPT